MRCSVSGADFFEWSDWQPGGCFGMNIMRLNIEKLKSRFFDSLAMEHSSLRAVYTDRISPAVWVAVFFIFFILYCWMGFLFSATGTFSQVDVFFGADVRWMMGDWAEFSANHYRTNTHPLGVLMVNPPGSLLTLLTGSVVRTSVLMTAAFGAAFVVLSGCFFLRIGISRLIAIFCTLLTGFSSTHLLWSSVPDYFLLDGLALLFFMWVCAAHPRRGWLVVLSAVIAAGAVTTHILLVTAVYLLAKYGPRFSFAELFRDGGRFFILIFSLICLFAVLQDIIYPSSTLFFHPHALQSRTEFISEAGFAEKVAFFSPCFFFFNLVFPSVTSVSLGQYAETGIRFVSAGTAGGDLFTPAGWGGVGVWAVLLLGCFVECFRQKCWMHPVVVLLAFFLLFHMVLHMFYGRPDEYFLYTPHWTFLLISAVGLMLTRCAGQFVAMICSVFILLLAWNNGIVIFKMLSLLG